MQSRAFRASPPFDAAHFNCLWDDALHGARQRNSPLVLVRVPASKREREPSRGNSWGLTGRMQRISGLEADRGGLQVAESQYI